MTTTTSTLSELPALKGSKLGTSDWIEVTQDRVNLFADATDDHQMDPCRRRTREGREPLRRADRARLPDPVTPHPDVVAGPHRHRLDDGCELRSQQGPFPRAGAGRLEGAADRDPGRRRRNQRRLPAHRFRRHRARRTATSRSASPSRFSASIADSARRATRQGLNRLATSLTPPHSDYTACRGQSRSLHHRLAAPGRLVRTPTPVRRHIGSGFTQAMLTYLARQLGPLRRASSPFGTSSQGLSCSVGSAALLGRQWSVPG